MTPEQILTPESVQKCQDLFREPNPGKQIIEIELRKKGGGTAPCEMSGHPVSEAGLKPVWVCVTRDISQRKKSDAQHAVLEASLRQNQKFESLGTMAGGIAHDFNNILAVIVGIIALLRREVAGNENANTLLDKLKTSSEKATGLVQRILTFSRQSKGNKSAISLARLVDDCVMLIESGIPKAIRFTVQIEESDMRVLGDSTQLEQVILNTVSNAIEAITTESGRIDLQLTREYFPEERLMSHGGLGAGEYACIQLTDSGSGMSARRIQRIFEPFYTTKDLGNGMGLAIVRSIVLEHGGAIDIRSAEGEGATLKIYIPLTQVEVEEIAMHKPSAFKQASRRILVIDDKAELLEILALMLEHLGHESVACVDSVEALALIDREAAELDLVITDYSMPQVDGLEVINHCQVNHPDLPVVLSTGFGDALPQRTASGEELIILHKPFELNKLEAVLTLVFEAERAGES